MAITIDKAIPVLDTRKVLEEHLIAKACPHFSGKPAAREAVLQISADLQNKDIIHLLEDETDLVKAISVSNRYKSEKQDLGEELFCKVSEIEPDLSAKITGMLLELDNQTIKQLILSEDLLLKAVEKSKEEYLSYAEESRVKEEIGEDLFVKVSARYPPELASRLTGMLLELRTSELLELLTDSKELESKLDLAYEAFVCFDLELILFIFAESKMASHQDLADFIKKVHIDLRLLSRQVGAECAWEKHCHDEDLLKRYASAMKELATDYWEKNNAEDPALNRIWWVVEECKSFYGGNGWKAAYNKEMKMHKRFSGEEKLGDVDLPKFPLKLLDVGSCYNPFKKFDLFEVVAIDIAPASDDVVQCDFLHANVDDHPDLPRGGFDVVLFSFLLEYLPHPRMRFLCCAKAKDLLRPGGILVILTPDSKHDSANARVMKSWRHGLAALGLMRTNYQKLKHLRCMTFYKCFNPRVMTGWLSTQTVSAVPEDSIIIPQDLNPYEELVSTSEGLPVRTEPDNAILAESFAIMASPDVFDD